MKFEDEFWVTTKELAISYAKTLVASSECEHMMDSNKPTYPLAHCLVHAKKQLRRNISLSEKERKLFYLQKIILKQEERFYNDELIRNCFGKLEDWYAHLGEIKLNKIFLKENHAQLNKVKSFSK